MSLNPFNFERSWVVKDEIDQLNQASTISREKFLEKRLAEMEAKFQQFQKAIAEQNATMLKGKGKGKGKGKRTQRNQEAEIEEEAQKRLRLFLDSQRATSVDEFQPASSHGHGMSLPSTSGLQNRPEDFRLTDDAWTNDTSSVRTEDPVPVVTTRKVYITRIDLTINGTSVDQIQDIQTEDECMQEILMLVINKQSKGDEGDGKVSALHLFC
jgi:hypothetical protein